ncbi:hypothetical protein V8E54_002765 [Elaphomyces granulatus]
MGKYTVKLVKSVVSGKPGSINTCCLPDNTSLKAWMCGSGFMTQILGTESAVISIAQQLAWLRTSPYDQTIATCTPRITDIIFVDHYSSSTLTALCKISFDVDLPDTDTDGLCWQASFEIKPYIVQGYPVANRKDGLHGLDISMAGPIQTRCITWFSGLSFVKGFSTLAAPTKVEEGTFL